MSDSRPVCNWPLDANGFVFLKDMVEPEGGCRLPEGLRGFKSGVSLVDENGHPADSDDPAADKCNHRDTPEWQRAHPRAKLAPRKAVKAAHREAPMSFPVSNPVAAVAHAEETPAASPAALTATVAVPAAPSADDLSRIAAHAGGGATGILMALIAVVGGGGAVWKYLQGRNKQRHEERMKELELQADNQRRDDEKHGECKTARDALVARIESMEQQGRLAEQTLSNLRDRLDAVSAKADSAAEKASSLSASAGASDETDEALAALSKRMSKVETAVKAKKKEAK
jgi:hypothetical protein